MRSWVRIFDCRNLMRLMNLDIIFSPLLTGLPQATLKDIVGALRNSRWDKSHRLS